jgi:O-antigen/teichoic acid export membrane protein
LDLVIVAAIYGPSDAGIYSIAVTATAALMVLYEPISGHLYAFFHNSSRGRTDTQQAETHQILSRWFSVVFTASLIVAVTWFFALEPIFGADFSPAAWLAVALSASSAFAVLASITSDLVIARGKPGASLRASSLGFVLFWVVLIFSYRVPLVGVIASLFAWYFSTTLLNLQALEVNPLKLRWSPALSVQGFRELLRVGRR